MADVVVDRLPDQLRENLQLVFVGTAAGKRSASDGHYYAHRGNRFWSAIHDAGITARRYEPREFSALLQLGIGFTDLSKSHAGMDHAIPAQSIDVSAFRSKIVRYRPKAIAFTSKNAAALFYNKPAKAILLGRQTFEAGFPEVFVLSSPSGAASSHWTPQPWHDLAKWLKSQSKWIDPAQAVLIRPSAQGDPMPIQHFPPPPGIKAPPLSFAARTGDLLYISGIPGFDDNRGLPDSFEAQFRNVVVNIKRVLDEAGGTFRDLVKVNVLLTRASDVAAMNALYAGAFGPAPYPARTTCVVVALPDPKMLIEIEAVASLAR